VNVLLMPNLGLIADSKVWPSQPTILEVVAIILDLGLTYARCMLAMMR
jgi:hypothetical protein